MAEAHASRTTADHQARLAGPGFAEGLEDASGKFIDARRRSLLRGNAWQYTGGSVFRASKGAVRLARDVAAVKMDYRTRQFRPPSKAAGHLAGLRLIRHRHAADRACHVLPLYDAGTTVEGSRQRSRESFRDLHPRDRRTVARQRGRRADVLGAGMLPVARLYEAEACGQTFAVQIAAFWQKGKWSGSGIR